MFDLINEHSQFWQPVKLKPITHRLMSQFPRHSSLIVDYTCTVLGVTRVVSGAGLPLGMNPTAANPQ